MAKKYILYEGSLRISPSVEIHLQLVPEKGKKELVRGGGWWHADDENKILLLYACSTDFGYVDKEELIAALPETWFSLSWNGYQVFYSEQVKLDDAILDMQPLNFVIER